MNSFLWLLAEENNNAGECINNICGFRFLGSPCIYAPYRLRNMSQIHKSCSIHSKTVQVTSYI